MHTRYSDPVEAGPSVITASQKPNRRRSRESGNIMIMFTLMMPFLLVPMVGLAIDSTVLFSVKAKLQAAVDGGAIAAAQSLNAGLTFTAQKATAEKIADQFIKANFVASSTATGYNGYWGAYNLNDTTCGANPCIVAAEDNANRRRTVSVTASVQVPLLFMRVLGFSTSTVSASGMAARRDVVMVLVLDRSSSMTPALSALQAGATYFVNQFQPGRDRLGLVVFGGSAMVAYPPTDWNNTTPVGPDTHFRDTPDSSASPNMLTSITNMAIGSNTGTADALMLAYKELKAANQPGALNAIVLWTDGQPNGITANFNNSTTGVIKALSGCINKTDGGNSALSMIGWMAQVNGFKAGTSTAKDGRGIYTLSQYDSVKYTSVTDWLKSVNGNEPVLSSSRSSGCAYATNQANIPSDLTIPTVDYYGNSTTGSSASPYTTLDYQQSEIWNNVNECNNGYRRSLDLTKPGDACQVGLASWNAADMAGKQIRADTTFTPVIYAMGYKGNGGDDPVLMQRLANVKTASNTVYDSTKPQGLYLPIATVNDIGPAFQYLLAEILRIAL
jgi:Flp pilus assembly protein TadG